MVAVNFAYEQTTYTKRNDEFNYINTIRLTITSV